MCPEGPEEAAKVLLNSEVALLPKGLHHKGPLLTTVKQADTPEMLRMLSYNIWQFEKLVFFLYLFQFVHFKSTF